MDIIPLGNCYVVASKKDCIISTTQIIRSPRDLHVLLLLYFWKNRVIEYFDMKNNGLPRGNSYALVEKGPLAWTL
jgi:hypothetical protein